jgi:hypothetical protein
LKGKFKAFFSPDLQNGSVACQHPKGNGPGNARSPGDTHPRDDTA